MKLLIAIYFLFICPDFLCAQQTEVIYLSGTGADHTKEWQFYCSTGMNSGKWSTIQVPSCWEQQGFGSYNYGHDKFENRLNETGLYRTNFLVPADWRSKQINLVFDGVMTDAEVKINGKLAGPVHQGAFYQFRYDIGKLLKYGTQNQLEVFVKKHSDNESVSQAERQADFWVFGGIFRPVYLEINPQEHIQRVAIDAKANGNFTADVYLAPVKNASVLKVEIQELSGKTEAEFTSKITPGVCRVPGKIDNPKTWNPEFPNLYKAVFSLLDAKNTVLHQHTEKFGFRTVEVRGSDGIYVNGSRIKMQGVNRHTFHPEYGRTSSKALSVAAVNLMKDMNMNAVRMSHYPPDKHFLDVCDSLGLFVLDELTGWNKPPYDDIVGAKLVKEMIIHDVNHPSIILWDNGNEGGENKNLNRLFSELDIQHREVVFPSQDFNLTNTLHYIDYNYLSLDGYSKGKIFFPTEFLHGLYDGGSGAGLEDYWEKMWNNPLCAGGFLWALADESVERTDRGGILDSDGNHAPDGIVGPYNEKEGSFYTIKELWSPVQFEQRYISSEFNGCFNIENRYLYTNLKECDFRIEWLKFSGPGQEVKENTGYQEEIKMSVSPGHKGILEVELPSDWQEFDAIRIKIDDLYGRNILTKSWPVKSPRDKVQELLPVDYPENRVTAEEKGDSLIIHCGDITVSLRKHDGTIARILGKGKVVPLKNGPLFVSKEKKVREVKHYYSGNKLVVEVLFEDSDTFRWTFTNNGLICLDVSYVPADNCLFAGITFDFPEEHVAGMKWLGNGPYRVYKNRMKGTDYGLWEKTYNNSITGESGFGYPEFKGYHSGVYWCEVQGKGVPGFKVFISGDAVFLRMLTPESPKDPAKTAITYPAGDISFLHCINPIGTKFKDAFKLGPQSNPYFFNTQQVNEGKFKFEMNLIFDFQ